MPLLIFGAGVSGIVMYWKDWKGFRYSDAYFRNQSEWHLSPKTLLTDLSSRTLRRGFFTSLGVAYLVALASAFILAGLTQPPLSEVQVYDLEAQESRSPAQVPGYEGHKLRLLAHADGYWYLVDKDAGALLVIPDRDDRFFLACALTSNPRHRIQSCATGGTFSSRY
jgi:hypothetical protein